jgi:dUTP pyrophosphatase
MSDITVGVQLLPHATEADLPHYATEEAAGMDLRAAIPAPIRLEAGKRAMIPTGIAIALPPGTEGQVRPRSGLAAKHGITVLNSPGTVDSDYRGEIKVILINHGEDAFEIEPGMRIAQLVVTAHLRADLQIFTTLPETIRGASGFGSTGLHR